jgi:2-polyprenyl-6-methoxyphenol hydroxylase-like FAD-dependent oxidoreductase
VTGRLAELLAGFAAPVPAILDTLGPAGAVHVSPIEEVTLDRWSQGSVLLVGDASTRDVAQHGRRCRNGP